MLEALDSQELTPDNAKLPIDLIHRQAQLIDLRDKVEASEPAGEIEIVNTSEWKNDQGELEQSEPGA
jgi:hypothetical protein